MSEILYRVCPDCHNWKSHVSMCRRCDASGFLDATAEVAALRSDLAAVTADRDRLLVACEVFINAAADAYGSWDADRDSRVGKLLAAMSGNLPGYRAELMAAHADVVAARKRLGERA